MNFTVTSFSACSLRVCIKSRKILCCIHLSYHPGSSWSHSQTLDLRNDDSVWRIFFWSPLPTSNTLIPSIDSKIRPWTLTLTGSSLTLEQAALCLDSDEPSMLLPEGGPWKAAHSLSLLLPNPVLWNEHCFSHVIKWYPPLTCIYILMCICHTQMCIL